MSLASVVVLCWLEGMSVVVCLWLETHLSSHTRNASLVDDKHHVDARDRLRRQFRRPRTNLALVNALLTKRQLHVPVTGRQAVRVVIAAKHDNRCDPLRVARDGDVEVAPISNLVRGLLDLRSHGALAVLLEQVRRGEQKSDREPPGPAPPRAAAPPPGAHPR